MCCKVPERKTLIVECAVTFIADVNLSSTQSTHSVLSCGHVHGKKLAWRIVPQPAYPSTYAMSSQRRRGVSLRVGTGEGS